MLSTPSVWPLAHAWCYGRLHLSRADVRDVSLSVHVLQTAVSHAFMHHHHHHNNNNNNNNNGNNNYGTGLAGRSSMLAALTALPKRALSLPAGVLASLLAGGRNVLFNNGGNNGNAMEVDEEDGEDGEDGEVGELATLMYPPTALVHMLQGRGGTTPTTTLSFPLHTALVEILLCYARRNSLANWQARLNVLHAVANAIVGHVPMDGASPASPASTAGGGGGDTAVRWCFVFLSTFV